MQDNRYYVDNLEYNSEHLSSDLYLSIVDETKESWQEVVERRCNQNPYSNNETIIFPTFHFMILFDSQQSGDDQLFHLIVFHNHSVSDGRSGFIIINDFLTLATTPNLHETSEPLNTDILPLIGQMIPRPYGPLYFGMSFIGKQIFKRELRHMIHPRIPIKVTPLDDDERTVSNIQRYKCNFLFASSSTSLYLKLRQQCRLREMTLNGPLFGCLLLAIHHCFPRGNSTRLSPFAIGVPFDMRSRLSQSPLTSSSVGFFIGVGEVQLKRSLSLQSTRFWSFAHQCMTLTQNQLKRDGVPLFTNVFDDILGNQRDADRFFRSLPEGRVSEFDFSNIGKYPSSCSYGQGKIRLRGIHVINKYSLYRSSSGIYIACCDDGQLDFSLVHEMESDEKAKYFLDYYIRLIETCADGERCKAETTLDQLLKMTDSS